VRLYFLVYLRDIHINMTDQEDPEIAHAKESYRQSHRNGNGRSRSRSSSSRSFLVWLFATGPKSTGSSSRWGSASSWNTDGSSDEGGHSGFSSHSSSSSIQEEESDIYQARATTFARINDGDDVCPCLPRGFFCGKADIVQLWWLRWKKLLKAALSSTVIAIHCGYCAWLADRACRNEMIWTWPSWKFASASIGNVTLPLVLWLIFEWMRGESSAAARQAGWLFLYYWHSQMIGVTARAVGGSWLWRWSSYASCGEFVMTVWAVWWRVAMAEKAVELKGYARYVAVLGFGESIPVIWRTVLYLMGLRGDYKFWVPKFDAFYQLAAFFVMGLLCWVLFSKILQKTVDREHLLEGKHYLRDEAIWATHALRRIRGALVLLCIAGVVSRSVQVWLIYKSIHHGYWTKGWFFLHDVPTNLYLLCDFATLLMTVGFFKKQTPKLSKKPSRSRSGSSSDMESSSDREACCTENNRHGWFGALLFQKKESQHVPVAASHEEPVPISAKPKRARSSRWRRTVQKLGQRYITAGELLDFYARLKEVMSHFDPFHHTTNDIVRAVIIPQSHRVYRNDGLQGRAYADWLQEDRVLKRNSGPVHANDDLAPGISDTDAGEAEALDKVDIEAAATEAVYAECMVTHEWRNLFLHLVSAVLTDAIGQDEYGPVARDLLTPAGIERVRSRLAKQQGDTIKYWICAFCVNQHLGICGDFPAQPKEGSPEAERFKANRVDTVLKTDHRCCSCSEAKHWVGDQCEMNKFSDLMSLLSRRVPTLRQVVAIDRGFDLFSRVWCVAEMVTAHHENLPQNVCLLWKRALDANTGDLGVYLKLATISVENCSAARAEDREEILQNIRETWGVAEFDAKLQATIFGPRGLLAKDLVGFDVIFSAARAALRIEAARRGYRGDPLPSGNRLPI